MAMTDREIITQIIEQGKQELYGVIVERYSREVYAAALATARNTTIAEEAVQQAFVKAFENIERWRGEVSIVPYLKMIAHNTAISLLSQESRHRATPIESTQVADEDSSLAHEELLCKLSEAMSRLGEEERRLVELHYWEHLATHDIAHLLGISQSNVLVRLHRIRNKLKDMIDYGE